MNLIRTGQKGVSGAQLARMHGVSAPTMSRWLAAARQSLLTESRRILAERLRVTDSQLDSLAGLVVGQLQTNLTDRHDSSD